jgi:thymidylate kinase
MVCKGRLIAVECVDGAVLDGLVQRLYRWLGECGIATERTAEPTSGPVGAQIVLYRQGRLCIDSLSLALYDVADRMDHLGRPDGMLSWLAQGRYVLCARYLAFSYACHLEHLDIDWLSRINARCRVPNLTLFVDVEPGLDAVELDAHYRIAIDALQNEGQNVVIVDGRGGMEQLFARCCQHIAALHGRED